MASTAGAEPAFDLPDDEATLLAMVSEVADELEGVDGRRDELLVRRRALFLRLRSLTPPTVNRRIAEAARMSKDAVEAVLFRAKGRG